MLKNFLVEYLFLTILSFMVSKIYIAFFCAIHHSEIQLVIKNENLFTNYLDLHI